MQIQQKYCFLEDKSFFLEILCLNREKVFLEEEKKERERNFLGRKKTIGKGKKVREWTEDIKGREKLKGKREGGKWNPDSAHFFPFVCVCVSWYLY